jgi:hypothetical protein
MDLAMALANPAQSKSDCPKEMKVKHVQPVDLRSRPISLVLDVAE